MRFHRTYSVQVNTISVSSIICPAAQATLYKISKATPELKILGMQKFIQHEVHDMATQLLAQVSFVVWPAHTACGYNQGLKYIHRLRADYFTSTCIYMHTYTISPPLLN